MGREKPQFNDDPDDVKPSQNLEVYNKATEPTAKDDDFLERNNLGLGFYDENEIWQQLERFSDGIFSQAAFQDKIVRKAISETKRKLALEGKSFFDHVEVEPVKIDGWRELDDSEKADKTRREYIDETGEEVWERMDEDQRLAAIEMASGITDDWTAPHLRILLAQHEMSRSKGARALDNLFGRESKRIIESSDEEASRQLLGGGR